MRMEFSTLRRVNEETKRNNKVGKKDVKKERLREKETDIWEENEGERYKTRSNKFIVRTIKEKAQIVVHAQRSQQE